MKKRFLTTALIITMALGLCACDDEDYDLSEDYSEEYTDDYSSDDNDSSYGQAEDYQSYYSGDTEGYPFDTSLGSAKDLDGRVAVISVFVNDATTGWNFENGSDSETEGIVYNNLKIATDYLENLSKEYGRDMEMIYDFSEIPELAYTIDVDVDYRAIDDVNYDMDSAMWEAISNNIPTEEILNKVNATQAIYMMYFNTPSSNTITSCTRRHYEGMPYPYEMCFMFMHCEGDAEAPACFAHEMLHTFGAVDLYSANDVSQEYVDYAEEAGINDIMRTCEDPQTGDYVYDSIKNDVTDITAYYVGLTDYSETVEEWGLPAGEH